MARHGIARLAGARDIMKFYVCEKGRLHLQRTFLMVGNGLGKVQSLRCGLCGLVLWGPLAGRLGARKFSVVGTVDESSLAGPEV